MKVEDLKLKYSYRAMMLWEQVMGKPYGSENTFTSMVVLLWCIVEANNPNTISLENFFNWMDEAPEEFDKLCKWLANEKQRQAMLADDEEPAEQKSNKKKVKQK